MFHLFFAFLCCFAFVDAAAVNRVVVYNTYTATTSNDLIACVTGSANTSTLNVTLFSASLGTYVFCVSDESGFADTNFIDINTVGGDVFYPDGVMTLFEIGRAFGTSCFYSDGIAGFHERRF